MFTAACIMRAGCEVGNPAGFAVLLPNAFTRSSKPCKHPAEMNYSHGMLHSANPASKDGLHMEFDRLHERVAEELYISILSNRQRGGSGSC